MMVSIQEFYQSHIVDPKFDEIEYLRKNPDTADFYQPYCQQNNFTDKQRLYYHYFFYCPLKHKTIAIKVYGDLSQKIKAINSFLCFGKQTAAEVKVCWNEDNNFNDLFEDIPEIDFISEVDYLRYKKHIPICLNNLYVCSTYLDQKEYNFFAEPDAVLNLISSHGFCYEGIDCVTDMFAKLIDLDMIYQKLKPKHPLLDPNHDKIGDYIGVYVPKAVIGQSNVYTKTPLHTLQLQNISNLIESEINNNFKAKILLITNCEDSQKILLDRFTNHITLHHFDSENADQAQVDILFLLSQTQKIIANYNDSLAYVASKIGHNKLLNNSSLLQQDPNLSRKKEYDDLVNSVINSSTNISSQPQKSKIILYAQMFQSSTEVSTYNIYCLYKNLANKHIDKIILLTNNNANFNHVFADKLIIHPIDNRLTYKEWLDLSYKLHPSDIKILANSDIYFDDTLGRLHNIEKWQSNIMYVSSRKDETKDGNLVPSRLYHNNICSVIDITRSHDVWIYKNTLQQFNSDYALGFMGCDSKIIESLTNEGIQIINLYFYINCIHVDWRQSKTRPSYLLPQ